MDVEAYPRQINCTYGTEFKMPVVYFTTLMPVAYGRFAIDATLAGQVIKAKNREELSQ